jgi:hypothetical protein
MRSIARTLAAAFALTIVAAASARAQERPGSETARQVTLTADVIDLSCKMVHNLSGPDHRMCAQMCADNGIPLALFADGQVYVPVSMGMPGTGGNEQLKPFAEQSVRVTGKVIDRGGIQTIVIEEIRGA